MFQSFRDGGAEKKPPAETPPEKGPMLIQEGAAPKAAGWKNLPANDEWCPASLLAKYPELKAHRYEDNASVECVSRDGWRIVGATRRGKQHAHTGTHREDAFSFRIGARHAVLCVADGAGSSKWSRVGSHLAAARLTELLSAELEKIPTDVEDSKEKDAVEKFVKTQITKAIEAACGALNEAAAECKAAPKDFRCTLLTLVHFRGKNGEMFLANQIGDGAIAILLKDKSTRIIGASDSGDFSGEVSCFVPDDCARTKAAQIDAIAPADQIECILLCTDGVEDPFYPMQKRASEVFAQLYGGAKEKLADFTAQAAHGSVLGQDAASWGLGQWLGFEKRGENDDRTALALHRFPTTVSF